MKKETPEPKYEKPLSLHPLKPEEAIKKMFEADPETVEERLKDKGISRY